MELLERIDHTLREYNFSRFYRLPETPHYHLVPKDYEQNLRYREQIWERARRNKEERQRILAMCAEDVLYYINTFLYTYSPKDYPDDPHRAFITYPYQDDAILRMVRRLGRHDVSVVKSRDMGATWICLAMIHHRWRFKQSQAFLLTSRKEELVDAAGDQPRTLFWKLDYINQRLPSWMTPSYDRNKRHLKNNRNDSVIDGEATVRDLARGDRLTALFLDEHASMENAEQISSATRDATNCRISNSTPKGRVGVGEEFYKTCFRESVDLIVLHWSLHPEKARGLYIGDKVTGQVTHLDKVYRFPSDYPFICDGRLRSPWYDEQCARATSDAEIAQELDLDFARSGQPFFDARVLAELEKKCRAPDMSGEMVNEKFVRVSGIGRFRIWIPLHEMKVKHNDAYAEDDPRGDILTPPESLYVVGCDISSGVGGEFSSKSVASVFDYRAGKKVAEFVTPELPPGEFADYVVQICRWFHDAGLIWEDNGGFGRLFRKSILEDHGYPNIYLRLNRERLVEKATKSPGWWSGPTEKVLVLKRYNEALRLKKFENPCIEAIMECGEYVFAPDGTVQHDKFRIADGASRGTNHGDRVIADALCWEMAIEYPRLMEDKEPEKIPSECFAARRKDRERERRKARAW